MTLRRVGALLFTALLGCMEAPVPPAAEVPPHVTIDPEQGGQALSVVRVRVKPGSRALAPDSLLLFEGELSDYHLGRIDRGELPANLAERQVPWIIWKTSSGDVMGAPSRRLKLGVRHSVAARGVGRLIVFDVLASEAMPKMERLWPPLGESTGGSVVLCGEELPEAELRAHLEPLEAEVLYQPGFGVHRGRQCSRLSFDATGMEEQMFLLPATLAGFSMPPEPLFVATRSELTPLECEADEVKLGPGCASVEDDRVRIRSSLDRALLWRVSQGGSRALHTAPASGFFVLRGLTPDSDIDLHGSVADCCGNEREFSVRVTTKPARARLILNEVLANPVGPEPASEWIELLNDGSALVDLASVRLLDPTGAVFLPEARLEPGEYALLVREDYVPGAYDVSPSPETRLLRLPVLAKNGIANGGEALALVDVEGVAFSEFPPIPARASGVSIARVSPDAPDGVVSSFAEHAPPGASPGTENVVSTPP